MTKKLFLTLALTGFISSSCPGLALAGPPTATPAALPASLKTAVIKPAMPGFAGQYLVSHFAQSQYDWKTAGDRLDDLLKQDSNNRDLLKRSMVLAMGAGNLKQAGRRANELIARGDTDGLAVMIACLESLTENKPREAVKVLDRMPAGDVTDFVRPLLLGWAQAGAGKLDTSTLNTTSVHSYNGALIALFLNNKAEAGKFVRRMTGNGTITPYDAERAADIFAAMGSDADALKLYKGISNQDSDRRRLDKKIEALQSGKDIKPLIADAQIKSAQQGVAVAVFDLARILFQERSDATARLFANMALSLNPDMMEARLLLANALARNGRYDEALSYFANVKPSDPLYSEIAHAEADMLENAGRSDEAIKLLKSLFIERNDIDALIDMGDIYRAKQNYADALKAYNQAADKIGGAKIPAHYWYLLYARGMAYEREGDWTKAESDLKEALAYRPDHPYLMNYLAYGWADQGLHLEESLKMVQRASALRPTDGYIADSLGWVLFVMGRYTEAVPQLEKAVGLLPYDSTLNDHLGDAYWKAGRKLEAHFQWERALGNAAPADRETILSKIEHGPADRAAVKEANVLPALPTP
jgi:tetratricopeptide (TPR) repeat protein